MKFRLKIFVAALTLSIFGLGCASAIPRNPASDISTKVISIIVDRQRQVDFKVNEAGYAYREKLKETTRTQGDFNLAKRNFSLEIDGVIVNGVHSVEGFENETEIIEYKDGEDGTIHTRPGNRKPGTMVVVKDWSGTDEFSNWQKAVLDGKGERKSISVIFHNDAGEEAGRLNLYSCYPTKWSGPALNAKNSGPAQEKIEISWETMDLKHK